MRGKDPDLLFGGKRRGWPAGLGGSARGRGRSSARGHCWAWRLTSSWSTLSGPGRPITPACGVNNRLQPQVTGLPLALSSNQLRAWRTANNAAPWIKFGGCFNPHESSMARRYPTLAAPRGKLCPVHTESHCTGLRRDTHRETGTQTRFLAARRQERARAHGRRRQPGL
jgi:hypothetical protein